MLTSSDADKLGQLRPNATGGFLSLRQKFFENTLRELVSPLRFGLLSQHSRGLRLGAKLISPLLQPGCAGGPVLWIQ